MIAERSGGRRGREGDLVRRFLRFPPCLKPPAACESAGREEIGVPCTQGAAMTRFLDDILMFACATALVTGIVLAAASLLI